LRAARVSNRKGPVVRSPSTRLAAASPAVASLVARAILATACALPGSGYAEANGGAVILARGLAGPYHVSVWMEPTPPRRGLVDLSVAVMKPESGQPAVGTEVRVHATSPRGDRSASNLERGAGGNLLLHHGELDLREPGRWQVLVEVTGPAGPGEATFEVNVLPSAGWTRAVAWMGSLLALFLVAAYYRRRQRRMPTASRVSKA